LQYIYGPYLIIYKLELALGMHVISLLFCSQSSIHK